MAWYGEQVASAEAVVCHLTSTERQGARIRNARYALVSGLAFGMGNRLIILSEGDFLAPLDYRDILKQYRTASAAIGQLDPWLAPLEADWKERSRTLSPRKDHRRRGDLKSLNLGDYIAENEGDSLVQGYFVETAAYREALQGTHTLSWAAKAQGNLPISCSWRRGSVTILGTFCRSSSQSPTS